MGAPLNYDNDYHRIFPLPLTWRDDPRESSETYEYYNSGGTQDSVLAIYLNVSDDHRNTKSKSTNIQRRGGGSHEMMKMKLQTNLDLLI